MEAKINVAEILKDKPENTKLYSPLFGDVYFSYIENSIINVKHHGGITKFFDNSRYYNYPESEPLLFPSKEMRDWRKFDWKKGDVLVSNDSDSHIIFKGFSKDDYTTFEGKHWISVSKKRHISCLNMQNTQNYHIEDNKEVAQTYINTIEEKLGGKLNLETLEIEKQSEFKDGDIVCISGMGYLAYGIVKSIDYSSKKLEYYVLNDMSILKFGDWLSFEDKHIQPITETQQIILFEDLSKEGKAWDAEKKAIVDLKQKVELKPFDRCIWKIRNCEGSIWRASFVSYVDEYGATPMGMSIDEDLVNLIILPYNEETAKLIGTTNNWEG